ncbi:MAG TPA: bifunctional homocysteine S-methyltransferase/methylenetetrahydrofolate reductase [Gaiellaceae bacterium]|nr:bifunctional homocysteine S-methyltransferase/methylenetetrahydrofolate reductase [Gaiellaceae bacterium]HWJ45209.1 bifunctional homocysteine S-methyltransferase/methylenetetrahydrofolate reductase [Gaiellaceae bacterium]
MSAQNRFLERLETGPAIVGDGGMGALLSAAVPRLRTPEEANIRAPQAVVSLHVSFINAGAELIETNSFGANRRKLAHHFLEDDLEAVNSAAVKLAREAREVTGRDVFIAGSIGPLGEAATSRVRRDLFAEVAAVLDGRGVDVFMVETFYDLEEVVDAVEAVRSVSTLPIVALLTFDESAETLAGVTASEAAERLGELDIAAIGANHGAGLLAALTALERMGKNGKPLAALPNVGLASLAGGRVIYPHATPEYFAEFAAHARDLGARVIGGCCGTTPAEISAIRSAVEGERKPRAPLVLESPELIVALGEEQRETGLSRAFAAGEWVVSVQLDPPLGGKSAGLVEVAAALEESGRVGWVDINDNATARAGMSSLMVSATIERVAAIETIPHLTTRDWSVMGLESMLLGAHAEGVRNILAITGDPPEVGDYPGARGVYEIDSIGLTQLMTNLNRGEDFNGRPIDAPTSFFPGVAVNPTADDLGLELDRFHQKVEAGAKFAITQIVFDLQRFDDFTERLGGSWPIPVLIEVFPLTSHRLALRLHNELPGIIVPDAVQEALLDAGSDAATVGFAQAREIIAGARERAAGVCLVAPFRRPLRVLELL